jgi:ABC-type transport system involved in multi-copper enzyme maturation permease subunit
MKGSITKEWKYAVRSGKLLVLLGSFLFLALATPLMYKFVLPAILEAQMGGVSSQEISVMMNMGQRGVIQSYIGDVFEIGSIVVAFSLCGLVAQEISENTLVIPLCSGKRFGEIIVSKLLVFSLVLILVHCISTFATYGYSGLLFSFEISTVPVLIAGLLQGVYMIFLLSCVLMWGVILKKPIPTGFASLGTVYGLHFLGSIFSMEKYLPSGLMMEANRMITESIMDLNVLVPTVVMVTVMTVTTIFRMKRLTWNGR